MPVTLSFRIHEMSGTFKRINLLIRGVNFNLYILPFTLVPWNSWRAPSTACVHSTVVPSAPMPSPNPAVIPSCSKTGICMTWTGRGCICRHFTLNYFQLHAALSGQTFTWADISINFFDFINNNIVLRFYDLVLLNTGIVEHCTN